MLTRPELESKQLLTICVEPGKHSHLKLKNKNIVYMKDGELVNQCSLTRLLHLMIVGDAGLTTNLIRELHEQGVTVSLLKPNLAPYAYFGFETQANFVLRSRQYLVPDEDNLAIAREIVCDKIHNQAVLLRRIQADDTILCAYERAASMAASAKELLGIEGSASKAFFRAYYEPYGWVRRSPRTKEDPVNFLLDIGYTVLFNMVDAICRHFGLDTYKGVYHTQFFARRSLVCDLMEPFRCLIDNRTRTALGLKIFTADMFKTGKYGVYTEWKHSAKITQTYAVEIMEHRQTILAYIQAFYRHTMDPANDLAHFRLKR
ncbi:MAG: CRISPR-associated endonuclease Cas1 [Candidatus Saccharimonadales bacterium]